MKLAAAILAAGAIATMNGAEGDITGGEVRQEHAGLAHQREHEELPPPLEVR